MWTLGEEYYKVLSMFLNCEQYMSPEEFNVIRDIRNLDKNL